METKPRFSTRQKGNEVSIYYDISISTKERLRGVTDQTINSKYWNNASKINKTASGTNHKCPMKISGEINSALSSFSTFITDTVKKLKKYDPRNVKDQLKTEIEVYFNRIELIEDEKDLSLFQFIDKYIEDERDKLKIERVSDGTIGVYVKFRDTLKDFEKHANTVLTYNYINLAFYKKYVKYLKEEKNYAINTIGSKHVKYIKMFMKKSWERSYHDNRIPQSSDFKILKEKKKADYLNVSQLENIKNKQLPGKDGAAIDYFLLMSYSGLRIDNILLLRENNIITYDGERMIVYDPAKKDEEHAFIITKEMEDILKKWDGKFPNDTLKIKITRHDTNKAIKKVTGNKNLVNHSARRSYCTNAFLSGMSVIDIMQQSNHSSEKVFYDYIKATGREITAAISKRKKKS